MQESLYNTVQKLQNEQQKVNIEELEAILNTDIDEVVSLCKKACLKPKTDSQGGAFFTKEDVNILRKMKELYSQTQSTQQNENFVQKSTIEEAPQDSATNIFNKKVNFLQKAKAKAKQEPMLPSYSSYTSQAIQIQSGLQKLEDTLINKMSEILSEKMDGFDEIIVELIRTKTENENLRQKVNSLNKQVYILKNELGSYQPLALGLYVKRDFEEL